MENGKKPTRRDFLKLVGAASGSSILAACAPAPSAAPASPAAAAAPSGEQVELRLTFWGNLEEMPAWNDGINQFSEKHPDIKVSWENTPWGQFWTKLQTQMAGGMAPDVTGMVTMYSQQYIRQGSLMPLDDWFTREPDVQVDDFWPAMMKAYQWKGKNYALPYDASTMLIFYNKKHFDEAGVPHPTGEWTWDEFLAANQKLTKPGQWGFQLPNWDWNIDAWLSTNGARFISEDTTKCLLDTPQAIETVQFLADLRNKYKVAPTLGDQGDIPLFETGKLAMTWGNPEFVQVIKTRVGPPRKNDKFAWDVALIPKKTMNGNALAGGSFAISKDAKHPEQAWTFIKFYTSPQLLKTMVGEPSRGIPGRKSVSDALVTDQNPEHQQFFIDVLSYSNMGVTSIPAYQQAVDIQKKYLDPVMLGEMTAQEACPKLVAELNPILERTAGS